MSESANRRRGLKKIPLVVLAVIAIAFLTIASAATRYSSTGAVSMRQYTLPAITIAILLFMNLMMFDTSSKTQLPSATATTSLVPFKLRSVPLLCGGRPADLVFMPQESDSVKRLLSVVCLPIVEFQMDCCPTETGRCPTSRHINHTRSTDGRLSGCRPETHNRANSIKHRYPYRQDNFH